MNRYRPLMIPLALMVLAACSETAEEAVEERALPVTAVEVRVGTVERTEHTVGRVEAATDPTVSAEVAGRVVELLHDVGDRVEQGATLARVDDTNYRNAVQRLDALHAQQARTVERLRALIEQESVAQSMLDDAEAQLSSLAAQLRDATTALRRTQVVSPVAGRIQQRFVSVGDFRAVGEPLFRVSTDESLRVVLPYPERLSSELVVGLPVRMESPVGGRAVAEISELRPMVGTTSRALEAIVELDNPGGWRPGGSVNATVVLGSRDGQVIVPTQSVVQRPAGHVVYVVDGDRARARAVEVGERMNGETEILDGLQRGERVVLDGAGFLTDGARIAVREAR